MRRLALMLDKQEQVSLLEFYRASEFLFLGDRL